jgi:hypothetical protein
MTSVPTDTILYELTKKIIYKKNPVNSAYRSGALVKEYKKRFMKKHGDKKPYVSKTKKTKKKTLTGLTRWFKEEWKNQRGDIGYKFKGDIYRPTKKISKKTPKTFNQLSKTEIKNAMKKKKKNNRVDKF